MILISAGTFSPEITSTMSPLTSFSGEIWVKFPSLSTFEFDGNIFLNPSIKAYDLADCINVMVPVSRMTKMRMNPRYKLGRLLAGWMM